MLRKAHSFAILLILLGTLAWSLIMVKSALIYPFGMGFWGPNGHDGVWHIALINQLAKSSLRMPTFADKSYFCLDFDRSRSDCLHADNLFNCRSIYCV